MDKGKIEVYTEPASGVKSFREISLKGMAEKSAQSRDAALSGDIVFKVSPATGTPAPTAEAWTQPLTITLETAGGVVHDWFSKTITTAIAASNASTAGTASMTSTTLAFVNGVATAELNGDAADWLNAETATATVAQQTVLGYTVTAKTCVLTFTTA